MNGERSAFRGTGDVVLGLAVVLVTYAGWRLFWFLTDDAFIAFRYASNSVLGHGLVWNPPPFRPVEGYTSFLWIRLLEGVWRLTGVDPPRAANWLSLAFGYATLALGTHTLLRMRLPPALARHRRVFLALVLVGILTNRTFLTWLSSGLETALFSDIKGNPIGKNVEDGVTVYRATGCDGVIAFGGGSALDAAKAIALMVGQDRPIWDFEDREDWSTRVNVFGMAPVVAVPTTAGTGSEVGRASVITDQ